MGAAALMTDREVTGRLSAYLKVESVGSSGPAMLFETGPGNAWLVRPWARRAPHPRGGSFALEIYKRLPNDTDFSIIKPRRTFPASTSPRSATATRTTRRATRPSGCRRADDPDDRRERRRHLHALDATDITQRSPDTPALLRHRRHGRRQLRNDVHWLHPVVARWCSGVVAWVRVTAAAVRIAGLLRWMLTFAWARLGAVRSSPR